MNHQKHAHLAVRVSPAVSDRVDALAGFSGQTRAAWVRTAIALADSEVTLNEIDRVAATTGETEALRATRAEAEASRKAARAALGPKPSPVAASMN